MTVILMIRNTVHKLKLCYKNMLITLKCSSFSQTMPFGWYSLIKKHTLNLSLIKIFGSESTHTMVCTGWWWLLLSRWGRATLFMGNVYVLTLYLWWSREGLLQVAIFKLVSWLEWIAKIKLFSLGSVLWVKILWSTTERCLNSSLKWLDKLYPEPSSQAVEKI